MNLPKLTPATWLKDESNVFHITDQQNEDEEYAFLVLYLNKIHHLEEFTPERKWVRLFHQTAGHACHHRYITATFLKPKPEIIPLLQEVQKKFLDSLIITPARLTDINSYSETLKPYGLFCEFSYPDLEEGFYPLDIACLPAVTSEITPEDLDNLRIQKETHPLKKILARQDWRLAILTNNCD